MEDQPHQPDFLHRLGGPNPVANLLDMSAFVTVIRASVEEHRKLNAFGESVQPMLDTCRETKTFTDEQAATDSAVKLIAEKTHEGYVERQH